LIGHEVPRCPRSGAPARAIRISPLRSSRSSRRPGLSKIRLGWWPSPPHQFRRAPLSKELAEFFWLSEFPSIRLRSDGNSPIVRATTPKPHGQFRKPIPTSKSAPPRMGKSSQGPCNHAGYYKNPKPLVKSSVRTAGSAPATSPRGQRQLSLHHDRKKDLIKTAAGKFVAPQPIENALRPALRPERHGGRDKRKFIVALIVPIHTVPPRRRPGNQVRFQHQAGAHLGARFDRSEVKRLTVHLAQYETSSALLFSLKISLSTTQPHVHLKLKRRVVEQQYASVIESLYAGVAEPAHSSALVHGISVEFLLVTLC